MTTNTSSDSGDGGCGCAFIIMLIVIYVAFAHPSIYVRSECYITYLPPIVDANTCISHNQQ